MGDVCSYVLYDKLQLMSVLPARSGHALPSVCETLMKYMRSGSHASNLLVEGIRRRQSSIFTRPISSRTSTASGICGRPLCFCRLLMYAKHVVFRDLCRNAMQEKRLLEGVKSIADRFSEEERRRNQWGPSLLFYHQNKAVAITPCPGSHNALLTGLLTNNFN